MLLGICGTKNVHIGVTIYSLDCRLHSHLGVCPSMTFSKRSFEVRSLRARGRGPENDDAQEGEKIGVQGSMGKCRDANKDVKMWAKVDRKVLAQRRTGEVWL